MSRLEDFLYKKLVLIHNIIGMTFIKFNKVNKWLE